MEDGVVADGGWRPMYWWLCMMSWGRRRRRMFETMFVVMEMDGCKLEVVKVEVGSYRLVVLGGGGGL